MILLIGGTSESLEIADALTSDHQAFVLSVTTDYGHTLATAHAEHVLQTKFTEITLIEFLQMRHIKLVIDASHPFAQIVSKTAMAVCQRVGMTYVRFERQNEVLNEPNVIHFQTQSEVTDYLLKHEGKVYLSTGSKTAVEYGSVLGLDRVHVRVLPTATVLTKLAEGGYKPNQIDALEGPFSRKLNVELFSKAQAAFVVTKDSGERGGINEKIFAAQDLDMPCLVIDRPQLHYPNVAKTLTGLTDFIGKVN